MERANPVLWLDSLLPMVRALPGSAQKVHTSPVDLAHTPIAAEGKVQ